SAPARAAWRIPISIIGMPQISVSGLESPSARRREPYPAAMMTASIDLSNEDGAGSLKSLRRRFEIPAGLFRGQSRGTADKFVDHLRGEVVIELLRRMLAVERARAGQSPAFAALQRQLDAADRVHDHGRAVRAV